MVKVSDVFDEDLIDIVEDEESVIVNAVESILHRESATKLNEVLSANFSMSSEAASLLDDRQGAKVDGVKDEGVKTEGVEVEAPASVPVAVVVQDSKNPDDNLLKPSDVTAAAELKTLLDRSGVISEKGQT